MAQSIDSRLRRINEILEDNDVPCRLNTELTSDGIGRRFFLSWPESEATQELVISFTVGGVHHWLDGYYHGLMLGTVGIAFDFPPAQGCSLCHGQGYCECQIDQSGRDWNAHLPMSKADRTIRKIVEIMSDDQNWSAEKVDAIRDELFVGGYIQEGEWPQ